LNCAFDEEIDRRGTNSLKYDFAKERGKPEDALPLWVADMDFRTCPCVIDALTKTAKHGVFGYSESREEYYAVLRRWFSDHYNWRIQSEWVVKMPGVVFAICMAIRALTDEGDAVLIQRPVYYPFSESVLANRRRLVNSPLVYSEGRYSIDFDDFEEKIVRNGARLFILCSPHNPVGRVWSKEELLRLGDICVRHGVYVVSDEIHADFVYGNRRHTVFASLKPEFLSLSVTCTSPSKTFNLAGLQVSNILIADPALRGKIRKEVDKAGYSQLNAMGLAACQAAYAGGKEWLEELKQYLSGNLDIIRRYLARRLPEIQLVEPQGTYLAWLDFRDLGLDEDQLEQLVTRRAKLWLDKGSMFGPEGAGFERMNIACTRRTLQTALRRLERAVNRSGLRQPETALTQGGKPPLQAQAANTE
jgi:cystathionine beta-lyase